MVVTDTSYRRLGARVRDGALPESELVRRRRLATEATITFDVSLSIGSSTKYDDASAFETSVFSAIDGAEDDSTDLMTEIKAAATSATFDAVPTGSAVTSTGLVVITRPPVPAPSTKPKASNESSAGIFGQSDSSDVIATAIVGSTLFIVVFALVSEPGISIIPTGKSTCSSFLIPSLDHPLSLTSPVVLEEYGPGQWEAIMPPTQESTRVDDEQRKQHNIAESTAGHHQGQLRVDFPS